MHYVDLVGSAYLNVYPDCGNINNAAVAYGTDVLELSRIARIVLFAKDRSSLQPSFPRNQNSVTNFRTPISHAASIIAGKSTWPSPYIISRIRELTRKNKVVRRNHVDDADAELRRFGSAKRRTFLRNCRL